MNCAHVWRSWSDLEYYWDGVYTQKRYCRICNFGEIRTIDLHKIINEKTRKNTKNR